MAVCPKTGMHEADPKRMSWKMILAISRKRWVSKSNERESCGRIAVPGLSLTFLHCAMPKDKNDKSGVQEYQEHSRSERVNASEARNPVRIRSSHCDQPRPKGLCCRSRGTRHGDLSTNSCTTARFTRLPLSLSGKGEMSSSGVAEFGNPHESLDF